MQLGEAGGAFARRMRPLWEAHLHTTSRRLFAALKFSSARNQARHELWKYALHTALNVLPAQQ